MEFLMGKQTHFQQVPVEVVKQIAICASKPSAFSAKCEICGDAVSVEHCKTDEQGRAVHEKCYAAKLQCSQR
jgi:hypothetical protein